MKKLLGTILACLAAVVSFGQHSVLEFSGVAGFGVPYGNLLVLEDLFGAVLWRGAPPTASDYIQDGLVAMWDGIENAGWGEHDPNATSWKDLTGNHSNITIGSDATKAYFTDSSLFRTTSAAQLNTTLPFVQVGHTTEILIRATQFGTYFSTSVNPRFSIDWGGNGNYPRIYLTNPSGKTNSNQLYWDANGRSAAGIWSIIIKITSSTGVTVSENVCGRSYSRTIGTSYYNSPKLAFGATSTRDCFGHIYCIRDYDRILSDDEIAYNYSIDKTRFGL